MNLPRYWKDIPPRDGGTYMVVVAHAWGRGASVRDALKRVPEEASDRDGIIVLWFAGDNRPRIDGFGRVIASEAPVEIFRKGKCRFAS